MVYEVSEYLLGMNPAAGACKLQRQLLGVSTHEGTENGGRQ